jgi:glycosidase
MPAMNLRRLAVLAALSLPACGQGVTDPIPRPPSNPYDPGSPGAGGYGSGGGGAGGGGGSDGGVPTGPPQCDPALRRCPHTFSYAGSTALPLTGQEKSVNLIGDYRPDAWTNGDPMTLAGGVWSVTVPVPWAAQVNYKFHIVYNSGPDKYVPDPNNPVTLPDGFGGLNSLYMGTTCDPWTCASTQIACAAAPLAPGSFDWRDAVIYWAFIDRFFNGDPTNDAPIGDARVQTAANWQGGDWAGLLQRINSGYFAALGVNALWISVPVDNAETAGQGDDGQWYSGYHGYWPRDLTIPEKRFGSSADLKAMIAAAHNAKIKVIVDYAMNHVHKDSALWTMHQNDQPPNNWFNPLVQNGETCVCNGIANDPCNYDGSLGKSCWFRDYLPDWNFNNAAARDYSVSNAIKWMTDYGFDGFRLDAIKQIEPIWITDFRKRLLSEVETTTKQHIYLVGETFSGDRNLIKSFISPCTMLDGQFDFPLRAALDSAILMRQGKMGDLIGFMDSNTSYYGLSVMSTFVGNHDVPRAIHFAEDTPLWSDVWANGKDRNWTNTPAQPTVQSPYDRLAVAFTILMTNQGAPLIYYGDEIGLAGAGDPDNRRFMPWSGYSAPQQSLLAKLQKLGTLRAVHSALRRGDRKTLASDDDSWVYVMSDGGDRVYVAVNRSDAAKSVGGLPATALTDQMTGEALAGPTVMVPARTARVLTQ